MPLLRRYLVKMYPSGALVPFQLLCYGLPTVTKSEVIAVLSFSR